MPDAPVQQDPLPLNCPYCGRLLAVRIIERDAGLNRTGITRGQLM